MFIFFIIATNIPQWLKTGFKVQGNMSSSWITKIKHIFKQPLQTLH